MVVSKSFKQWMHFVLLSLIVILMVACGPAETQTSDNLAAEVESAEDVVAEEDTADVAETEAEVETDAEPAEDAEVAAEPAEEMMEGSQLTAEFPADVAVSWFDLQLKLIKETPGFSPPVASRALGYSGVSLYESVLGGMPEYNSLVGQLNELTSLPQPTEEVYHWAAAANSALATILRSLYPTATPENLAAIDALEEEFAAQYREEAGDEVFDRSAAFGQSIAEAVYEWSTTDGGHEGYAKNFPEDFKFPTGDGLWKPTPPNNQPIPLQPYWGDNRPFVLNTEEECLAPPPPEFSVDPDSQFYKEAMEVYDTVHNLTPEQETIALFWADDPGATFTPPGHSISIATIVLEQEEADLALAAETYARVGMSVADAFIGCWKAKFTYNLVRPISYIQEMINAEWNTPDITDPVITPPFPEYTSGHSVQSGAAATVLTDLFGDNYAFTDDTHVERGLAERSFDSFYAFADEAAISRLYGGIHYRTAIELGVEQGKCIGDYVNALSWKK